MLQAPRSQDLQARPQPASSGNPFAESPQTSIDALEASLPPVPTHAVPTLPSLAAPQTGAKATGDKPAAAAPNFLDMLPDELVLHGDTALQSLAQEQPTLSTVLRKEDIIVQALERRMAKLTPEQQASLRSAGPFVARAASQGYAKLLDTLVDHVARQQPLALEHPALAQLTVSDATILRLICKEAAGTPAAQAIAETKLRTTSQVAARRKTGIDTVDLAARVATEEADQRRKALLGALRTARPECREDRRAVFKFARRYANRALAGDFAKTAQVAEQLSEFSRRMGAWNRQSISKVYIVLYEHYLLTLAYAFAPDAQAQSKFATLLMSDAREFEPCQAYGDQIYRHWEHKVGAFQQLRHALMCKSGAYSSEQLAAFRTRAKIAEPLAASKVDLFAAKARAGSVDALDAFVLLCAAQ